MAHMNPDDSPIFILQGIHDFGSAATAVATKISDSAPANGEVIAAYLTVTEAKTGGTADDDTCIAADAAAAVKMTADLELDMSDTVYSNKVGSVVGVAPSATPSFSKGDDIYAYTNAQTSRTAGKYNVVIVCKKTS
jgi:hypothetical protein